MGKTVIAIVAIIVIGVGALSLTGTEIPFRAGTGGTTPVGQLGTTPPVQSAVGQTYNGELTVNNDGRDSNDPAVTYTGATVYDIICYERIGDDVRNWEVLDGGDDSATETMSIPVRKTTSTDKGITEMWCGVTRETAGADVYIDKDGTERANDRIATAIYDDADLDNTPEWLYQVNLLDIAPSNDPQNIPVLTLRLKFMEEATTANLDSTTASIISIGTGSVDNRIKWNVDFDTSSAQNDAGAKALSQIQIRTNTTSDDLFDINKSFIEVPMGASTQKIKLAQMEETPQASQDLFKFKYNQGTGQRDVASANLIVVPKGGDPEVDVPVVMATRFTAITDAICIELEFQYVDAFNVFSSTSDDVELVADTTNGDECTIA
jgi:hypothetical protein